MVTYKNGGPQYQIEEPPLAVWHKDKAIELLEEDGYNALVDYFSEPVEAEGNPVRPDGGRMKSGIYAHVDDAGFVFASYDPDFSVVEGLETPEDSELSTLEYVEAQFLKSDYSEELIDQLFEEGSRVDDPSQVGVMEYDENQIYSVEIDIPEYAGFEV
ncbi:hypothetical protein ACM16X_02480 [Haloarcula japonica]|uniref:hypothetical protein n=1 Tax=Haloarcula japonica TaxID=29282 RepID=UPI0039F6E5B4